jgi:hypothetical protein
MPSTSRSLVIRSASATNAIELSTSLVASVIGFLRLPSLATVAIDSG